MIAMVALSAFVLAATIPPQAESPRSDHSVTVPANGNFEQLAKAAGLAREQNRDDSATDLYRQALRLRPGWDEGQWYLGSLLYEKQNYIDAASALSRFLKQHPENGNGWALLGLSEYETHQYPQSLEHLQRAKLRGFGDDKDLNSAVSYITAILLTRSGKFGDSLVLLDARVQSGEDASLLIHALGLAALRMAMLPGEIAADRQEMVHLAGAAVVAVQTQRYTDADKLFAELEAGYPNQPEVHSLIGAYLLGAGDRPDEGFRELQREIEISPSHVPARIRLADEYIKRRELDQGIRYAREAVHLASWDASAHMVLGEGLIAKGDVEGGIKELETARGIAPREVRIRWDLVRAYTGAKRTAAAQREKSEIERLGQQDAMP